MVGQHLAALHALELDGYGYNGRGERVRKTVNGVTTRFRYGERGELLGEYDEAGQPIREYLYQDGLPIALLMTSLCTTRDSCMHQQHDRAYHRLFSEPALVEDLVRHFVEEPWVAQLDFSRMQRVNAKFHSEALERRDGDIIMRIPFLNDSRQEIYLFLLLEFQSADDHWMALRFGTYVHLLYEQLVREGRLIDGRLPPVFPLLLYNGDTAWRATTDLKSLIALPPNTPLWPYQPGMRYYLIDESRYPEGKPGSLSGLVMRLENVRTTQALKSVLEELSESVPGHLDSVRRALAVWINHVLAPHRGIRLESEDIEDLDEVKVMLATRIKQMEKDIRQAGLKEGIEQGIERGIKQGIERGFEQGCKTGETALLTKMLELKFGALPPWAQDRITQADAETIESWAANLLKAETLEAVFETEI
jgi:hypothetical protein